MKKYLELMKIDHWIKNLLIFAPIFFSLKLNYQNFTSSVGAFLAFSLIASSIYIINDIFDIDSDRKHFRKKLRPIASGQVTINSALMISLLLFILGISLSLKINTNLFYIVLGYFFINIFYSKWLKKIPIIDVMIIAIGFVMRILAGAAVTSIVVSHWIIICTFFGAMLMGFGKRKNEIDILKNDSSDFRRVLSSYEKNFLNQLIGLTSGITIMSYALYTIDTVTISHFKTANLLYTVPFVVFGVFRYFQIIYTTSSGEDPAKIFVKDWPTTLNLVLWAFTFGIIVY